MKPTVSPMQRSLRVLAVWAALPVLVVIYVLSVIAFESCSNIILAETNSPDGQRKVVLFERSCTHTVAWTTHASVLPATDTLPEGPGNALVSFERHGSLMEGSGRRPEVTVQWNAPKTVTLHYPADAPSQRTVAALGAVNVLILPSR